VEGYLNKEKGGDAKMLEAFADTLAVLATIMGSIMALGYFPQAYKIWKRKSVEDISLPFFVILFVGTIMWLLYGISTGSWPIIIANSIGVFGAGTIVAAYFKYKK